MFVPIGFRTYNKTYDTVENVPCPNCRRLTSFTKIKNKSLATVMFIPVICTTNQAYVRCSFCGAAYEVRKKHFKQIKNSADLQNAVVFRHNELVKKVQARTEAYNGNFSEKNQVAAAVLSILLNIYGVQFFYIGKPWFGALCILVAFAAIVSGLFPILLFQFISGIVYGCLIYAGKIKDGKGKYILNEKQKQLYSQK